MRQRLFLLTAIAFTSAFAHAQTQSVLTGTHCSQSCLLVNADPNLGGPPEVVIGCAFDDPVPIGATVRSIRVDRNFSQTFAGQNAPSVTVSVGNQTIGSATVNNVAACGSLAVYSFTSADFFLGFPGYNYGGSNTILFDIGYGALDAGYAQALITYDADIKSVTTTVAEPIIPTGSDLVNDCLQFQSTLNVFVSKGSTGIAGVTATISSNRNAISTIDTITEPGATDGTGHSTGYLQTRLLGQLVLTTTVATFPSGSTAFSVQEANFQSPFKITAYYTPKEADYKGKDVTNPCGVTGTFKQHFLNAVDVEGTGLTVDGRYISYDGGGCYRIDTCPRTSSGVCASAGHTAAIDRNIMEYTTNMNIANVGGRTAEDIGPAIIGYHIDNYLGEDLAAYKKWHDIKATTVRYLSGGGQCSN